MVTQATAPSAEVRGVVRSTFRILWHSWHHGVQNKVHRGYGNAGY